MHSIVQAAVMKFRALEQAGMQPFGLMAGGFSLTAGVADFPCPASTSPPIRALVQLKASADARSCSTQAPLMVAVS